MSTNRKFSDQTCTDAHAGLDLAVCISTIKILAIRSENIP